jgi:uncharacterized protein (TIGR03435 family)
MLRALLTERFRLRTHSERRELQTYVLVTTRRDTRPDAKLRPIVIDCDTNRLAASSGAGLFPADARPKCGAVIVGTTMNAGPRLMNQKFAATSMTRFAEDLQRRVGRPVLDKTGLTRTYDIEFEFLSDGPGGPTVAPGALEGPSVFTALEEQLGLKLQSERNRVEVLVIDSIGAAHGGLTRRVNRSSGKIRHSFKG